MRMFKLLIAAVSFGLLAGSPAAFAQNKAYNVLPDAQPTDSGKKVEVIEFFGYLCPHCNAFDPGLEAWVKKQGDNIVFKRIPVGFRPEWVPFQKMYYALEAMGKTEDFHAKIFKAIHVEHQPLRTDEDMINFIAKQGVDKQKFSDAYSSFSVSAKVKRASQLVTNYKVDGVPMIIVDGRYATSPSVAGTAAGVNEEAPSQVLALKAMDDLVSKSKKK